MRIEKLVLFLFLGINAITDLKKKEILLIPTLLYGFVALWVFLLSGGEWSAFLMGCIPGIFLLGMACFTRGQVGLGDAWIVLAMGLQLGFFPTLGILWGTILLILLWVLLQLAVKRQGTGRKQILPMVPFLFVTTLLWEVMF